jgi:hypothetical protein
LGYFIYTGACGLCKILAEYLSLSFLSASRHIARREAKRSKEGKRAFFLPSLLLFALFASSSTPRDQ